MRSTLILILFVLLGCKPDPIPVPEAVQLVAPANLNACTTADRIDENQRQVEFEWLESLHTDQYELVVQNSATGALSRKSTTFTNQYLILEANSYYAWYIISSSALTEETTKSEVWQFFLEGEVAATHLPFPAELLQPENEASVTLPASGNYEFIWSGSDLDNDISSYEVYLGTSETSLSLQQSGVVNSSVIVNLNPATTYYWEVITVDEVGNKSSSGVAVFTTK
ncbi:hypothetical protein N9F74_03505 [Flavobacteriaceae bacterium]|nr:hypothetical protein [Flavobacteriaceae bacterium]